MSSEAVLSATHRYYLKSRQFNRIVSIVCFVVAVVEAILVVGAPSHFGISPWFLVVLMLGLSVENLAIAQSDLITTSDGLTYHYMGLYSVQTSWANVDRVNNIKTRFGGKAQHLVLREPGVRFGWFAWLGRGLTIPLAQWDKYDELIQDITVHMPNITGI